MFSVIPLDTTVHLCTWWDWANLTTRALLPAISFPYNCACVSKHLLNISYTSADWKNIITIMSIILIGWRNRVRPDIHGALSRSQKVKGSFQRTRALGGRSRPGFRPTNKPASHACCPQPDQVTYQSQICAVERLSRSNVVWQCVIPILNPQQVAR